MPAPKHHSFSQTLQIHPSLPSLFPTCSFGSRIPNINVVGIVDAEKLVSRRLQERYSERVGAGAAGRTAQVCELAWEQGAKDERISSFQRSPPKEVVKTSEVERALGGRRPKSPLEAVGGTGGSSMDRAWTLLIVISTPCAPYQPVVVLPAPHERTKKLHSLIVSSAALSTRARPPTPTLPGRLSAPG